MSELTREWKEPRVRSLYSMAKTSRDGPVHREVLAILGAMERAGSKDAEWALGALREKGAITAIAQGTSNFSNTKGLKHEPERNVH